MSAHENNSIREDVFDVIETSLEAQLRAIRRLRGTSKNKPTPKIKSMSQLDMAYDILKKAKAPLHITEIISKIENSHHVRVDRESLVSAISKRVKRGDRFVNLGKNTYEIIKE